ncbi:MAG TPA: hypothetical protein VJP87_09255, partial [Candidatus Acidoferrales bacterium]|nr:hypothetical protein [Candidatus Acidoferrales bacterium]
MKVMGWDFHPSYQQIAMWDEATGEVLERALRYEGKEEVRAFYAGLGIRRGWGTREFEDEGAASFFEESFQAIQVALDKTGIGGELGIRHARLAKKSEEEFAA